jgi:acyl carrier protein
VIASDARRTLLDALIYANVGGVRDPVLRQAFLDGATDIRLNELEIDSLAIMELCITVEANSGVSITPDQLQKMGSLGEIVALMVRIGN